MKSKMKERFQTMAKSEARQGESREDSSGKETDFFAQALFSRYKPEESIPKKINKMASN